MLDQPPTIVVLVGGRPWPAAPTAKALLERHRPVGAVIAADSGLALGLHLGLEVAHVVGDLDSVREADLAGAVAKGAQVSRYPSAKDATDTELALGAALDLAPSRVLVFGGGAGRLDHLLGVVLLLAAASWWGRPTGMTGTVAQLGPATVTVARAGAETVLSSDAGDTVSLLPVGGAALGVRTAGLRYPLAGDDLPVGTSRGISNEFVERTATVRLRSGTLIAVQPGVDG